MTRQGRRCGVTAVHAQFPAQGIAESLCAIAAVLGFLRRCRSGCCASAGRGPWRAVVSSDVLFCVGPLRWNTGARRRQVEVVASIASRWVLHAHRHHERREAAVAVVSPAILSAEQGCVFEAGRRAAYRERLAGRHVVRRGRPRDLLHPCYHAMCLLAHGVLLLLQRRRRCSGAWKLRCCGEMGASSAMVQIPRSAWARGGYTPGDLVASGQEAPVETLPSSEEVVAVP